MKNLKNCLTFAAIAALVLQSFPAAAYDYHDRHGEHRWGHGYVTRRIGPGYRTIFWGGLDYLYADGYFYRHSPAGYIIVEPPVGALVPVLPAGYTTVVVQQRPYYYYDDTYYAAAPNGFVVAAPPVAAPVVVAAPAAPETAASLPPKDPIDTYEIHIPNDNGSYTLVTLKKVEKGFIGPQGEFYPEHPTVEQLKTLYGVTKK